jgi:DNA-binding Xre family transcriptional regulator
MSSVFDIINLKVYHIGGIFVLTLKYKWSKIKVRKAEREMTVIFQLKQIMRERRLTYREVAEGAGVAKSVLIKINSGKQTRTDLGTLDKLTDFLKCEVSDLIVKIPNK